MDEDYRIEGIETCRLLSHADFLTLPQIYTLRNLRDGEVRRLRLPRNSGWTLLAVVRLSRSRVLSCSV